MTTRVLMVCLGNICRSPLAEGILQHKVNYLGASPRGIKKEIQHSISTQASEHLNLDYRVNSEKVFVDSAGTGGFHIGNKPDTRSIDVAKKHGIDISYQRCRKFNIQDFTDFDIIYVMDKSNYTNIIKLTNNKAEIAKVKLLLDEVNLLEKQVPDPYYGGEGGFEHVFQLIDTACNAIAKKIV